MWDSLDLLRVPLYIKGVPVKGKQKEKLVVPHAKRKKTTVDNSFMSNKSLFKQNKHKLRIKIAFSLFMKNKQNTV